LPIRWLEMVRHTLKSLGPKVLSTRMLRDYLTELYVPTVRTARALNDDFAGARALAEWKHRVRSGWPGVRIEHVEASGVGDSPEVGATLSIQVYAALGGLHPNDVDVQVVHGQVGEDDSIDDFRTTSLAAVESYEGGRHRFAGEVVLDRTGPFGYSVRVLPRHPLLASPAELGLVVWPNLPGTEVGTGED
jgi:glycogen phosphorylase